MFELAQRLYAQMPLAALSLAGLGVALVWLILKSFLAMCFGKPVPEDAWAGPLPPGQVRHDWLRGGDAVFAWSWPAETLAWRGAQSADVEFEVCYRHGVWLVRAVFGLVGCGVMAYFAAATLPFLGADFVTRKVFFLALAPLVPALRLAGVPGVPALVVAGGGRACVSPGCPGPDGGDAHLGLDPDSRVGPDLVADGAR